MPDPKNPKEEDKVEAAYENISRKLESLRNGIEVDEEESDDEPSSAKATEDKEELEEWKGPKPMKNPKVPDEEDDDGSQIRRVKLDNGKVDEEKELEETEESKEEDRDKEVEKDEQVSKEKDSENLPIEKEIAMKPRRDWEPAKNDPLDAEEGDDAIDEDGDGKDSEESDEEVEDLENKDQPEDENNGAQEESDSYEDRPVRSAGLSGAESEPDISEIKTPQPDTLDDLTDESVPARASTDDEEDYFIPNLKGTGQRHSNMGYNTPIEREDSGESYKSSMDTNDPNNFFSQHNQPQPPKRASKFHLLILVIIGIVVIGFTVYILKGGFGELSLTAKPSPSPSPVESPSPTPTPTPEPNRSQYKLRVLNGSGKTGLAASVSAKLKDLGYQTEKTGNATNSAFTQTIVRVKPALESFIPQIVKDLAPDFDAAGNTSLKDTDAVDIEIILGAR